MHKYEDRSTIPVGVTEFACLLASCRHAFDMVHTRRYGRNGDWKRAIELLQDMRNSGLQPDLVSYSTVLAAVSPLRCA